MVGRAHLLTLALVVLAATGAAAARQKTPTPERLERAYQLEGEAVVALADAALAGKSLPSDFVLGWRNDYLKAQQGTFVPYVVSIDAAPLPASAAVMYVRLTPRSAAPRAGRARLPGRSGERFPVEDRHAVGQHDGAHRELVRREVREDQPPREHPGASAQPRPVRLDAF
ncbi:MAG TPA: hypothetical protein VE379_06765, partial [Vicinamibacterales bacterium]|nr:hypothetical protein [Vicinamibacterales bacterium]